VLRLEARDADNEVVMNLSVSDQLDVVTL
jgi:hypothetical protein